eukprot:1948171-Rhodomonas_salina.1
MPGTSPALAMRCSPQHTHCATPGSAIAHDAATARECGTRWAVQGTDAVGRGAVSRWWTQRGGRVSKRYPISGRRAGRSRERSRDMSTGRVRVRGGLLFRAVSRLLFVVQ